MRIDIAKELATCVSRLEGIVLDEHLHQPTFNNADYWFPAAKVVAELKCLTEDLSTKSDFNASVAALHRSWVKRGLLPRPSTERVRLDLRELPLKCAREFIEPIKKRLEGGIKKANRQIRETKLHVDVTEAKGLLLIANDGNYMLPPSMMLHLLPRILKGQFSNINSVVYFSVNELVSTPGLKMPSLFWIDALVPTRDPVALEFRTALKTTWLKHLSDLIPAPIFEYEGIAEPEFIDNIRFTKHST